MVLSKREFLIDALLNELSKSIHSYPLNEQFLFNDFLSTFTHHCSSIEFISDLTHYINKYFQSTCYFKSPFLWFSITFCRKVRDLCILEVPSYSSFVTTILKEVFTNLQKQVPLTDDSWELLQKAANISPISLPTTAIVSIQDLFELTKTNGLSYFNKQAILPQIYHRSPHFDVREEYLNSLTSIMRFYWIGKPLSFRYFGLQRGIIRLTSSNTTNIFDIFPKVGLVNEWNIFSSDYNGTRSYVIFYLLPDGYSLKFLENYLLHLLETNLIQSYSIMPNGSSSMSISLALLQNSLRWSFPELLQTNLRHLINPKSFFRENVQSFPHLAMNPNVDWSFRSYSNPRLAIETFGYLSKIISFDQLPDYSQSGAFRLSKNAEIDQTISDLVSLKTVQPFCLPFHTITANSNFLFHNFTISTDGLTKETILKLLSGLPYVIVHFSEDQADIFGWFGNDVCSYLTKKLNVPLTHYSYNYANSTGFNLTNFDESTLSWKNPSFNSLLNI